ncbi:MAG: DUF5906 domain-containing protein [Burkholderiales bacterium]|jgi:putative DNA primase/helicase|nr:DUF5906 domain-containing protein [Burkholderiales bacterium]
MLQRDFALVYGTDTVFDGNRRMLVRIGHLRLAYQNAVKVWLESPDRKMISADQVVFDPHNVDAPWNLFCGIDLDPECGDCDAIIELLHYICSERQEVIDWVLNWMAFPLKNVGAKMATSIVMRGKQGCGKNMFWNVVATIYGKYGGTITQTELESQYNDWVSGKLFLIGNEVLSRKEKWQLGGKLKNLVTEDQIPISAKYMSTRYEGNHCNLVFLSNDLLPVPLEEGDRRFLMIDTPGPHPDGEAFYKRIEKKINSGGVAAFYAMLLARDIGNFNPHTKPLRTVDFDNAVELSLGSSELFVRRWKAGELPCLEYGREPVWAGAASDLYTVYQRWCPTQGEKHVDTQTLFSRKLKEAGFSFDVMWIAINGECKAYRIYWYAPAINDACEDVKAWITEHCKAAYHCAHPRDVGLTGY